MAEIIEELKVTPVRKTREEDRFSDEVHEFFRIKLQTSGLDSQIECLARKAILRDLTIGPFGKTKRWSYIFGFQQQDIIFTIRDRREKIPLLQQGRKEGLIAYHWIEAGQESLIPPLLICELKTPGSMNTHAFIVYGKIAEQIKSVYPFCAYYFILSSNKKRKLMAQTVYRQAKAFDRVYLDWENQKDQIWEDIRTHLFYLRDRAGILNG